MITEKLEKGHLLIAEPSIIGDLSFNRSVILLADHTAEGSVGFISLMITNLIGIPYCTSVFVFFSNIC